MTINKQQLLWNITTEILENHGDLVDSIHIIENKNYDSEFRRIYHGNGYCFELSKEDASDSLEVEMWVYSFSEPHDGFEVVGIDKAIELLNEYAGLEIK